MGVIHTSWGGTPAEAWTSREALAAADPDVKVILDRFDAGRAKLEPDARANYEQETRDWQKAGKAKPPHHSRADARGHRPWRRQYARCGSAAG